MTGKLGLPRHPHQHRPAVLGPRIKALLLRDPGLEWQAVAAQIGCSRRRVFQIRAEMRRA